MELIDLKAKLRQETGKGMARALRRSERVPAIVYGSKLDPVMLSIGTVEFDRIVRDNGIQGVFLKLAVDGESKKTRTVMLKEVQMDVFQKEYLHVDFHEIDMEAKVSVEVPVRIVGEAKGVIEGGVLQIIRRELVVFCKPADVPDDIAIDVSDMEIGDAVHIEEIALDEKVEIPHEVDFTVITLVPPTAEEVEEEDEDLLDEEAVEGEEGAEDAEDAKASDDKSEEASKE
ncbi:MAG: 50S ribosomal protein L25 [Desulfobacteraceae bacterium]|nr:50S ribosomal protein L25 [Desulfobacteraceae bacterium]